MSKKSDTKSNKTHVTNLTNNKVKQKRIFPSGFLEKKKEKNMDK